MDPTLRSRARNALIGSVLAAVVLAAFGCRSEPAPVKADDPEITAAIEKVVTVAMDGADTANAEKALSVTTRDGDFTFLTGDTFISSYDAALATLRDTYSMVQSQTSEVISSRVRVLAPDVVLVTAVTRGTYTDKAVHVRARRPRVHHRLLRRNGQWQALHFHQSVAK